MGISLSEQRNLCMTTEPYASPKVLPLHSVYIYMLKGYLCHQRVWCRDCWWPRHIHTNVNVNWEHKCFEQDSNELFWLTNWCVLWMFAYRVVYWKHGREEGAWSRDLVLHTIEKTTGGDVLVITAGIQCARFVETYGKKMAQTVFQGPYEGGSGASWFDKKNGGYRGEC